MDRNLGMDLVRVTEAAALGSSHLMGRGDDVAVDAIEGPATCATGGYNALAVIAVADAGSLLSVPDTYMDKIACGPEGRGVVDLDRSPADNVRALAEAKGMYVEDLTVVVLDRPRHLRLIEQVRAAGARIKLISDGDVSAALKCLDGEMQARIKPRNETEAQQLREVGVFEFGRKYGLDELVRGSVIVAATGVTPGDYLAGVRYVKGGAVTNSVVMRSATRTVRFMDAYHRFDRKPQY